MFRNKMSKHVIVVWSCSLLISFDRGQFWSWSGFIHIAVPTRWPVILNRWYLSFDMFLSKQAARVVTPIHTAYSRILGGTSVTVALDYLSINVAATFTIVNSLTSANFSNVLHCISDTSSSFHNLCYSKSLIGPSAIVSAVLFVYNNYSLGLLDLSLARYLSIHGYLTRSCHME